MAGNHKNTNKVLSDWFKEIFKGSKRKFTIISIVKFNCDICVGNVVSFF